MHIEFTITTSLGDETFYCSVDENENIEPQIHDVLAEICFCDAYEIKSFEPVTDGYMIRRIELICEYEDNFGLIEDNFTQGPFCCNATIEKAIEWERGRKDRE